MRTMNKTPANCGFFIDGRDYGVRSCLRLSGSAKSTHLGTSNLRSAKLILSARTKLFLDVE